MSIVSFLIFPPQLALPLLGVSDHGEARSHRLDVKVTACCSQTHSIKVLDRVKSSLEFQ